MCRWLTQLLRVSSWRMEVAPFVLELELSQTDMGPDRKHFMVGCPLPLQVQSSSGEMLFGLYLILILTWSQKAASLLLKPLHPRTRRTIGSQALPGRRCASPIDARFSVSSSSQILVSTHASYKEEVFVEWTPSASEGPWKLLLTQAKSSCRLSGLTRCFPLAWPLYGCLQCDTLPRDLNVITNENHASKSREIPC